MNGQPVLERLLVSLSVGSFRHCAPRKQSGTLGTGRLNVKARKTSERQRLEVAIPRDVASRLKSAAARRDLTIRQYVLHAIEDRIRADLGGRPTEIMTSLTDPVLAQLWNNGRDATYDQL